MLSKVVGVSTLVASCLISTVLSFPLHLPNSRINGLVLPRFMSSSEPSNKRTRRTRRKEEIDDNPIDALTPVMEWKPRSEDVVQLKIADVRDVVAGMVKTGPIEEQRSPSVPVIKAKDVMNDDDDDELADDEEWEYYDDDDDESSIVNLKSPPLNSLEQMLADAKSMRSEKIEQTGEDFSVESPTSLKNILSTIVTADFFFVCALLVWFLAGIFSSSVLKDDTIQIAFNSNFQMIAQPALGLLMIGSAASAFFKEETEDDVNYDTS